MFKSYLHYNIHAMLCAHVVHVFVYARYFSLEEFEGVIKGLVHGSLGLKLFCKNKFKFF